MQQKVKANSPTFVHDNVRVLLYWFGVVDKPLQEDTSSHKSNLGDTFGPSTLHTNLITNSLPNSLSKLLSDSFGNVDGSYSSRLSTDYLAFLFGIVCFLKQILGHLSRLSTSSVSWDYDDSVLLEFLENLVLVFHNWQLYIGWRLTDDITFLVDSWIER